MLNRALAVLLAGSIGPGCTRIQTVRHTEDGGFVVTGGSYSTGPYELAFSGRVLRVTGGERVPATNARFWRRDSADQDPTLIEVAVDRRGRFSTDLLTLVCRSGRHKWVHGTSITIDAPGCAPVRLYVDERWASRTIKLACDPERRDPD